MCVNFHQACYAVEEVPQDGYWVTLGNKQKFIKFWHKNSCLNASYLPWEHVLSYLSLLARCQVGVDIRKVDYDTNNYGDCGQQHDGTHEFGHGRDVVLVAGVDAKVGKGEA